MRVCVCNELRLFQQIKYYSKSTYSLIKYDSSKSNWNESSESSDS